MNSTNKLINYTSKHISEFTPEDTIYITKIISGFMYTYYCQFVKFERGVVYGNPIYVVDRSYINNFPEEVKARLNKCYLWGNEPNSILSYPHCHWFTKNGTVV